MFDYKLYQVFELIFDEHLQFFSSFAPKSACRCGNGSSACSTTTTPTGATWMLVITRSGFLPSPCAVAHKRVFAHLRWAHMLKLSKSSNQCRLPPSGNLLPTTYSVSNATSRTLTPSFPAIFLKPLLCFYPITPPQLQSHGLGRMVGCQRQSQNQRPVHKTGSQGYPQHNQIITSPPPPFPSPLTPHPSPPPLPLRCNAGRVTQTVV